MQFHYCSNCGGKLPQGRAFAAQHCPSCGVWQYHNSKPCAEALVMQKKRVLLAQRAVEPFKGYWDIPGGFLEAGEDPEKGVRRELAEETGLEIRVTDLLGIYIDSYGQDNYFTLNVCYIAEPLGGELRAMDDVAALKWFALDELPNEFAFKHQNQVMKDLKKRITDD